MGVRKRPTSNIRTDAQEEERNDRYDLREIHPNGKRRKKDFFQRCRMAVAV